jgi:hypothetical protein
LIAAHPDSTQQEELMAVKQHSGSASGDNTAQEKAQDKHKENEEAADEMRELEAGVPPTDLTDWPSGPAKYLTYGMEGDEDNSVYGAGVTSKLGPANLERFKDGSIAVDGKKVDTPDDYKGEPIPGGPTDPNAVG